MRNPFEPEPSEPSAESSPESTNAAPSLNDTGRVEQSGNHEYTPALESQRAVHDPFGSPPGQGNSVDRPATTYQPDPNAYPPTQVVQRGVGPQVAVPVRKKSWLERKKDEGGLLGGIATALLVAFKYLSLLKGLAILKPLLLVGSASLSAFAYSFRFGWPMAIGFVLLIFVHEMGHVWAAKRLGIHTGWVAFIPFMGALMTTKRNTKDAADGAFLGIMGPVFGGAAAIAVTVFGIAVHMPFAVALGSIGCWLNLFNLAPIFPLDGGWVAAAVEPKLWAAGLVILLVLQATNPMVWIIVLLSVPFMYSAFKKTDKSRRYFEVPAKTRVIYFAAYVALAVALYSCYSYSNYVIAGFNTSFTPVG